MNLTKVQFDEMSKAATPLIKWMNENCHPHCRVEVDQTGAVLLEEIAGHKTNLFVKD